MSDLAIYDGTRLVGFVGNTGRGLWQAKDASGRLLSSHHTRKLAEEAVAVAAKDKEASAA